MAQEAPTPVLQLTVQKQYFDAIKSGAKTVEGRCNTPKYQVLTPGCYIRLTANEDVEATMLVRVCDLKQYPTFEEMLKTEGLDACLPGVESIQRGVAIYHGFPGYAQAELEHGVLAIHVQPL